MDLRKKLHVDLYKHPLIGGENKDGYYYPPHWLKGDAARFRNRELYSTLDSLDAVVGYMVACDFTDGGWYALAYQAEEIQQIKQSIQSISNCLMTIASILSNEEPQTKLETQPVKNAFICCVPESEANQLIIDEWISLYDACANWQKEAMEGKFDITFNPWQIRNWIKDDDTDFLKDDYQIEFSQNGKRMNCKVKKEGFLDKFVKYRLLSSQRHPKHFKPYELHKFINWRNYRGQKAS